MPLGLYTGPNVSTGNGVTTVFSYTFKINAQADLKVKVAGVEVSTGFTVSGIGSASGGNVTFAVAPANGAEVYRGRAKAYRRDTDYQRNGSFDEETVDADFDGVVMQIQQLEAMGKRAIKAPESVSTDQVVTDADWTARAGTVFGFDALGTLRLLAIQVGTSLVDLAAAAGSSLIGFIQGGVGAVLRTLQGKAREQFSVLDFIPANLHDSIIDGTNVTDLKPYIQAALDAMSAAGGGVVLLPRGSYRCESKLTMPSLVDLVGESRLRSRLMFHLTGADSCIDLAGPDTNNRIRSTLRRLRVDGSNCSVAGCVGVEINWNQSQNPILDEVTIYGGYQALGASTGLQYGLKLTEDGSNWIISFQELKIEGCYADGMVLDTASGGATNILNFFGGSVENNAGRNVVIIGPNDDIASFQVNFYGTTIEGASLNAIGVASSIHIEGAKVLLDGCWLEAGGSPNWATFEIQFESGHLTLRDTHIAWCQRAIRIKGRCVVEGENTIRSSNSAFTIYTNGTLVVRGEPVFLGAGTPIFFQDNTSFLDWTRNRVASKTDNYTLSTSDIGSTLTNSGAKKNITLTMNHFPSGATVRFLNAGTSLRTSAYRWTLSGSGTNEYYLELAAGGDPGLADPTKLYTGAERTRGGTVGTLNNLEWEYGDNDALGFNTVYFRVDSGDPDAGFSGHGIFITYTITIAPSNNQRLLPTGTGASDSVVDNGSLGNMIEYRTLNADGTGAAGTGYNIEQNKVGTWA